MEREPVAATEGTADGRNSAWSVSAAERLQVAALAVLGLSLALGAVRAMQAGWIPVGDEALIEMRVRDVPGRLPLLGVYSRFGWSHPGPAQFLLLALPYRLLGSASASLLAGALAGHLFTVGAAWWIARRVDRLVGVVMLVTFEIVLVAVPSDLVRSAWNPYVALLGAGLMVIVAWGWAERVPVAAMLLLPLSTLLVQAHVGNLPLVVMVVAASSPLAIWWHSSGRGGVPATEAVPWRALGLGALVATLLWIPAIVEQFSADPGNVTRMVRDLSGEAPRSGVADALDIGTHFFGWWPAWADQRSLVQQLAWTGWTVPIWLVVPVLAVLVAARRRDARMLRGLAISAVGVASTMVAAAAVKGVVFSYLLVGHRSIVAVFMAVAVATLLMALPPAATAAFSASLSAVAVVLAAAIGMSQWSATNPSIPFDATVRAVTTAVEQQADGSAVFITSTGDDPSRDVASGLLLQLERAGVRATTVRDEDWRMGPHRTSDGVPAGALDVRIAPVGSELMLADEGYRVLFEYQPLDTDEVASIARLVAERDEIIAEGESGAGSDRDAAIRFVQIQELIGQIDALRADTVSTLVGVRA